MARSLASVHRLELPQTDLGLAQLREPRVELFVLSLEPRVEILVRLPRVPAVDGPIKRTSRSLGFRLGVVARSPEQLRAAEGRCPLKEPRPVTIRTVGALEVLCPRRRHLELPHDHEIGRASCRERV